jgi:tetratricopeptide (TPR) repeat protein
VARQHGEVARVHARSAGDQLTLAETLLTDGAVRHATGDYAAADDFIAQALQLLERANAFELAARGYAGLLEQRKEYARSLSAWKKAYHLRRLGTGA